MLICAVMAVVNATKTKSRGLSAVFLSVGFVVLGTTVFIYAQDGLSWRVWTGVVLLFACLIGDAGYRIWKQTVGRR
jgi:hypothetical protein